MTDQQTAVENDQAKKRKLIRASVVILVICVGCISLFVWFYNLDAPDEMNGRKTAEPIIEAIQAYKEKYGRYPDSMDPLVPTFISSIPNPDFRHKFEYWSYNGGESYVLSFISKGFALTESSYTYCGELEEWIYPDSLSPDLACQSYVVYITEEATNAYPSLRLETPTPNSKNRAVATETLTPTTTKIPDVLRTPTATQIREATPTYQPTMVSALKTMDALVTIHPKAGHHYIWECIVYPCYVEDSLGLSPNGLWAVFFVSKGNDGGLLIASVDGEIVHEIYHKDIFEKEGGVNTLAVVHWSLDGRYVYLEPRCECSGGYFWFWKSGAELIRFDLKTGAWVDTRMGSAFSFSPNDQYLTYRTYLTDELYTSKQEIRIHKFKTGSERIFTPPQKFTDLGRFVWSPDSKKVIFIVSTENLDMDDWKYGFSAYVIDLDENSMQLVYKNDPRYLYPVEWDEPSIIRLESLSNDIHTYFYLNLETREITPASH